MNWTLWWQKKMTDTIRAHRLFIWEKKKNMSDNHLFHNIRQLIDHWIIITDMRVRALLLVGTGYIHNKFLTDLLTQLAGIRLLLRALLVSYYVCAFFSLYCSVYIHSIYMCNCSSGGEIYAHFLCMWKKSWNQNVLNTVSIEFRI